MLKDALWSYAYVSMFTRAQLYLKNPKPEDKKIRHREKCRFHLNWCSSFKVEIEVRKFLGKCVVARMITYSEKVPTGTKKILIIMLCYN